MPLRSPNLDDRDFEQLVADALHVIDQRCPEWSDRSPGDPGMVLVDVFAHLTETMLYRLNRLPEKAYIEFLRLIGVKLYAPTAASTQLRFSLARAREKAVTIPRGTRVSAAGGADAPVFVTLESATIDAGATGVEVPGFHATMIDAELLGHGTGLAGQSLRLRQPPVVAATDPRLQLVVGVEVDASELGSDTPALRYEGKAFRIWREVQNFSDPVEDRFVFVADRLSGLIQFAPAIHLGGKEGLTEARALAEIPPKDAEIRAWYLQGGGDAGNVTAQTLTQLKDAIPGVQVTNPAPASGGRATETLDNAMRRGAQEIHALHRAVTARDFEMLAERSSGAVARARAFTRAAIWRHAQPGAAELVLVPSVPTQAWSGDRVTLEQLHAHENVSSLAALQKTLDERRPLGTQCLLSWARYKQVVVKATVVVYREEDPDAVRTRVLRRLNRTLSPLAAEAGVAAWPFGHALTNWHVYKVLSSEPGVRTVDDLTLQVDHAPDAEVRAVTVDAFQPNTWYAAAGDAIYRSMNNGEGWEQLRRFDDESPVLLKPYPREAATPTESGRRPARAGFLAVVTEVPGETQSSRVYFSTDCGDSWEAGPRTDFQIYDMAWVEQNDTPGLMLATEAGLYYVRVQEAAVPEQLVVEPDDLGLGFYNVAVSSDAMGGVSVAVAARGKKGVYLSHQGGQSRTFSNIGLRNEEVRVLEVQHVGLRRYIWAGMAAVGDDPGKGCFRWLLTGAEDNPEGWIGFDKGWDASSCRFLAFVDNRAYAATQRGGVLSLDLEARDAGWKASSVNGGLPLRELRRFEPVDGLAASADGRWLMAAGMRGIYRSQDGGGRFESCSSRTFSDRVTLPPTWLFCSGEHEIKVIGEDELQHD